MNKKDIFKILEFSKLNKDMLKNKNILISGAFGFIGKYLLNSLLEFKNNNNINLNIVALDNFITSDNINLNEYKDIEIIKHDIIKPFVHEKTFDYIICLAGIASPFFYNKFPLETLNVSINGLLNMFKVKHNTQSKFIFFSSSEIYGDPHPNEIPTREYYNGNVTSIGPRSCYDESKRVGETICYIQNKHFNKNTTIIRPFNVYGPGMSLKDYRIIPNITKSIIDGDLLEIYDTGLQTRTYCYVVDALNGFLRAIFRKEKFEVYNIGNTNGEISVLDLVKTAENVIDKKINYKLTKYPEEYPFEQPQRRCPDIQKAKNQLGYIPNFNLEKGLYNHLKWSIDNL